MKIVLVVVLFSSLSFGLSQSPAPLQSPISTQDEKPNVTISLVEQTSKTDPYSKLEYARLRFRVENQSNRDVLLYGRGSDTETGFSPFGHALRYDNQTKEWRKPTFDNSPFRWAKEYGRVPDCVVLPPKKEVIIQTSVKYEHPREPLKQVMYIAFYGGIVIELVSPEFILK